jgi:hypothetical protein
MAKIVPDAAARARNAAALTLSPAPGRRAFHHGLARNEIFRLESWTVLC